MTAEQKIAHISWFKPPGAWAKRIACLIDGEVRYMTDLWTDDIIETRTGKIFRPTSPEAEKNWTKYPLVYDIPGEPLTIARDEIYDGNRMREEWPSPTRRRRLFGPHVFDVNPNDDSLSFTWTSTDDDLRRIIIGIRYFGGFDRTQPN